MRTRAVSRRGDPVEVYTSDDAKAPKPVEPPVLPVPMPTPIGLRVPIGTLRVDGTIDVDIARGLDDAILAAAPDDVILLRADHPISADDHRVVQELAGRFDRTVMVEEEVDG